MTESPEAEMARQHRLLATPLGVPGSGHLRYGAAMYFRQQGLLSDPVLEVYRICAPRDQEDASVILAMRGLALPFGNEVSVVHRLIGRSDDYLATLNGPGVAEVRAGIARGRAGPVSVSVPAQNAVVSTWLAPALDALAVTHADLAAAIHSASPLLHWITYDGYDPDQIGADFARNHAYATLIGDDGAIRAEGFDFGVFLIAPHIVYRDHFHKAAELYAPLTGPHGWRFAPDTPLTLKPAHMPVWNPPSQPHLTKVGPTPFLCLFGWTSDVNAPAQVLPATDWPRLEALRLDAEI